MRDCEKEKIRLDNETHSSHSSVKKANQNLERAAAKMESTKYHLPLAKDLVALKCGLDNFYWALFQISLIMIIGLLVL